MILNNREYSKQFKKRTNLVDIHDLMYGIGKTVDIKKNRTTHSTNAPDEHGRKRKVFKKLLLGS